MFYHLAAFARSVWIGVDMKDNDSHYTKQSITNHIGKYFRFFSEIPFTSPDDPQLIERGKQALPRAIELYDSRDDRFCPQYGYLRGCQLDEAEGGLRQTGKRPSSHFRAERFWGDAPRSLKLNWHGYDVVGERGVFDWDFLDAEEVADAKKGRPFFYYRVDIDRSLQLLTNYSCIKE